MRVLCCVCVVCAVCIVSVMFTHVASRRGVAWRAWRAWRGVAWRGVAGRNAKFPMQAKSQSQDAPLTESQSVVRAGVVAQLLRAKFRRRLARSGRCAGNGPAAKLWKYALRTVSTCNLRDRCARGRVMCTVLCHVVLCVCYVLCVCCVVCVCYVCVCVCPPSPLAAGACGSGLNQVLCFVLSVLCCVLCTAAPHVFHSLPSSATRPSKARKRSRGAARLAYHANMDSSTSNSVSPSMGKKSKGQSKMRARKARTA